MSSADSASILALDTLVIPLTPLMKPVNDISYSMQRKDWIYSPIDYSLTFAANEVTLMTQTPATPQAGTTGDPQPQAGDPTTTPTPQAGAGKTPEDYERMIAALRQENAGHRTKLKAFEEAEAVRQQAQMSELEKAQKATADTQEQLENIAAEHYKTLVYLDVNRLFSKFDFIEGISSELIADMLLVKDDEVDFENGKPTNIKDLIEKLVKAQPGLLKPVAQQQQQRAPATPGMNPGRSNITPPGAGNVPGRIPRLSDPGIWNKK